MAQLNLYVPDALAAKLRARARKAKKSLSAYVVDVLEARETPSEWPPEFWDLFGSWEGEFPEIEELPLEDDVPSLDDDASES